MSNKNIKTENVVTEIAIESIVPVTYNVTELLTNLKSKSAVIRYLSSEQIDTKGIYKILTEAKWMNNENTHPIRYQHVRNVLNTIVKKK